MSLEVVRSFGVLGRFGPPRGGLRKFGVPVGGAFDWEAYALANALARCEPGQPAWELGMANVGFRAGSNGVVGVAGAFAELRWREDTLSTGCAFQIGAGEEFTIASPSDGARVYVAFSEVASSVGKLLRLDSTPPSVTDRELLRVVEGAHIDQLSPRALAGRFEVSRMCDRVGVRLEPRVVPHSLELTSEPQCVGAVQVSNDGSLIVLGPDGPTIGGYPKLAVVASCDVPKLGQLRPGDSVSFDIVSIEEARRLGRQARERLDRRIALLKLAAG